MPPSSAGFSQWKATQPNGSGDYGGYLNSLGPDPYGGGSSSTDPVVQNYQAGQAALGDINNRAAQGQTAQATGFDNYLKTGQYNSGFNPFGMDNSGNMLPQPPGSPQLPTSAQVADPNYNSAGYINTPAGKSGGAAPALAGLQAAAPAPMPAGQATPTNAAVQAGPITAAQNAPAAPAAMPATAAVSGGGSPGMPPTAATANMLSGGAAPALTGLKKATPTTTQPLY